ncbi:Deoxyribonuclease, TatD [Cordyceps fumosorosea ARSEF 2679]|uniref:Deoxyribonuclease, TatD n=1 Tax=Cordyceps fumosorosea (strain ARSEF 2679) TaxID=1081104 RepID=A0A168B6Y3_CORFA|nr:Deoxyribonuclease, TatD [Cordyceps fumosorosea ARSEF 2679]OAA69707.1 Deoxyribonuclease, TatD [Cordyceps fumosorosea ARSEF 2679]
MTAQEPIAEPSAPTYSPRYVDIGINLADRVYRGSYRGNQKHPDDLDAVVDRAKQVGCTKLMVTGSDWHSIKDAIDLANEYRIHPCSSSIFGTGPSTTAHDDAHVAPCDPDPSAPIPDSAVDLEKTAANIAQLKMLIAAGVQKSGSGGCAPLVALGEFGLDYDRLHFCNKAVQLHSFAAQLRLAAALDPARGDARAAGARPTDGPWCEVRPSHAGWKYLVEASAASSAAASAAEETPSSSAVSTPAAVSDASGTGKRPKPQKQPNHGKKKNQRAEPEVASRFKATKSWQEGCMIKGRNEPCTIERIATIVAGIKGVSVEEVCEAAWRNTNKVFHLDESA